MQEATMIGTVAPHHCSSCLKVDTVELPGGIGVGHVCPYCTKVYPTTDTDDNPVDMPATCKRCGSPMDKAESQAFADAKAIDEQQAWPHRPADVGAAVAAGPYD